MRLIIAGSCRGKDARTSTGTAAPFVSVGATRDKANGWTSRAIRDLADVQDGAVRLVARQEGAGSRLLLEHLLREQHLDPIALHFVGPPVRSETELALAVRDGKADAGFGIAAVARQCRVDFVLLHRERYDLVMRRWEYFEPPFQRLLAFTRTTRFVEKAAEFGGYDVRGVGHAT